MGDHGRPFLCPGKLIQRALIHAGSGMLLLPLLRDHWFVDLATVLLAKLRNPLGAQFARTVVLVLACHFLTRLFEGLSVHGIALIQTNDRIATLEAKRLL